MTSCGYTSDEIIEALHVELIVEVANFISTIKEDVQVPQSNYQEENEGQHATTETPEHTGHVLHSTIPTPLLPSTSTRQRTTKRI